MINKVTVRLSNGTGYEKFTFTMTDDELDTFALTTVSNKKILITGVEKVELWSAKRVIDFLTK